MKSVSFMLLMSELLFSVSILYGTNLSADNPYPSQQSEPINFVQLHRLNPKVGDYNSSYYII